MENSPLTQPLVNNSNIFDSLSTSISNEWNININNNQFVFHFQLEKESISKENATSSALVKQY